MKKVRQGVTYCVIPRVREVGGRWVHRDRKKAVRRKKAWVSFWQNKTVLELDRGNACAAWGMHQKPLRWVHFRVGDT